MHLLLRFLFLWLPVMAVAQHDVPLALPNHPLLSSERVNCVMQDEEGFLWYATNGNGLCRDDGRQIDVFRSDREHPNLLGSNNVLCLASRANLIIIGTTHGASVLNKSDYSISHLTEIGDKRINDIMIAADGHWWLAANKTVYEYSATGTLLRTLDAGNKYAFRLHQDKHGQLWCRQWEGGMLRIEGNQMIQVTTTWPDSIDLRRITTNRQGQQLVADENGKCYVLAHRQQQPWFDGTLLTTGMADTIRTKQHLNHRPTALATDKEGHLWFSTGKDIRCVDNRGERVVLNNTKDVSAMAFSANGTLWLATIYGQLYRYQQGKIETDEYGSNEYGDAVIAIAAKSADQLLLVSNHYTRIYNIQRHTLQQQSNEAHGTYRIELQETQPYKRWSSPNRQTVVEQFPKWMTSWWMCTLYALLVVALCVLTVYVVLLRRQRTHFLKQVKTTLATSEQQPTDTANTPLTDVVTESEWLNNAIAQVEAHMDDENYTVEQLSLDLNMSRMTFYRKLHGKTGQSPTEFIRTIRLRHAAKLLREGRLTVTEISYATGFSSVSYFSRCFRTMFGVPPTQYQ